MAQVIRAIDAGTLSQRAAATQFGVDRNKIARARKAIAEGRAALPALPADEVETEVAGLDDALERILARGRSDD